MKPRPRSGSGPRRPSDGPFLEGRPGQQEECWTLFLPPPIELARLFRDGDALRAADVIDALAALGYQPELARADGRTLPPEAAIDGRIELRDPRLGKGHLAIEMFPGQPGQPAVASLEAVRDKRGRYAELARFLIVALGKRLPGLTYKATYSALTPEDVTLLAASLPDRPDL